LVRSEIAKVVVGQENLIRDLLVALLGRGHILLE
jgi:MoxR-like ATPase